MSGAVASTGGITGMDMMMSQITGMAMMRAGGSGGGVDISSMIWTLFTVFFLQRIIAFLPVIGTYFSQKVDNFLKDSARNVNLITSPGMEEEKQEESSIEYTRVFDSNSGNNIPPEYIIADAILDRACKTDNARSLNSNGQYYVNHKDEIDIGDGLYFKQISTVLGDNSQVSKTIIRVYSYTLTLTQLRRAIQKISEEYRASLANELGDKLFYFEDIPVALPKTMEGGLRYETASPNISFRMNPFYTSRRLNNVYGSAMKIVKNRVRFFLENRDWYDRRGIPHTLGLLLHGPPGCGKTSLIKAIANECNRHVFSIRLSDHNTRTQLTNIFFSENVNTTGNYNTRTLSIPMNKRLLVFEEIDTMGDVVKTRNPFQFTNIESVNDRVVKVPDEGPDAGSDDIFLRRHYRDWSDVAKKVDMENDSVGSGDKSTGVSDVYREDDDNFAVPLDPVKRMEKMNKIMNGPMFTALPGLLAANDSRFRDNTTYQPPTDEDSKMKAPSEKLDLGTILNLMDGILETPGRIIVMTSNHPEKLDPALIRPGRIDLIVKFDYCNTDEISEIYTGITGDELPLRILNAIPTNKYSPARITQAIFESFENPEMGLSKLI